MILNRIQPHVDPILDDSQAGFRWGSDLQVYTLLETLKLRQGSRTYCAFLDIRKAFDVAWRDGALLRLHRAGVSGRLWHLIDDFVSNRTAAVRIASSVSEQWGVENGLGQGAVLSGFLFNVLTNGLAAAIKRACTGVRCGPSPAAPRIHVLLYADDIVILSESPRDLQLSLDAAAEWAKSWRFHFAAGPQKSAVMCFGRGRARLPEFHVGGLALPVVKSYKYLGIVLQSNLGWRQHVDSLLSRGEGKMAACLSWTAVKKLARTVCQPHFPFLRLSQCTVWA